MDALLAAVVAEVLALLARLALLRLLDWLKERSTGVLGPALTA